ncbi:MAG: xanthine dehydrogenase family protein subunit M [Hyphomicrobiales bacterium]|nr:xanthine dehydrogenase family protein subunit M [Hyphomicrobiales bacterium]
MHSFNYVRPATVADAVKALSADATLMAGGQTLIPTLKQRLANPAVLVDLSGVAELRGVRKESGALVIGAMTTHAEVAKNADVRASIPALAKLAHGIGDAQVRHRGTIGGSVANNDPAADYPAAVLGLGATIVTNKRQIEADKYFTGMFSTALEPGEIITAIRFPIPEKAGYAKYEQRASRYCLVSVFVSKSGGGWLSGANVRVAVSGAGQAGVFRVPEMEAVLKANFSPEAVRNISAPANGLMSDMHGSAEYRAAMIPVMAERAVASV